MGVASLPRAALIEVDAIMHTGLYQRISKLLFEAADEKGAFEGNVDFDDDTVDVLSRFHLSRPGTIYGGFNEIQRNVVSKDVLRLPGKQRLGE